MTHRLKSLAIPILITTWFGVIPHAEADFVLNDAVTANYSSSGSAVVIAPAAQTETKNLGTGADFGFCVRTDGENCDAGGLTGLIDLDSNLITFAFYGTSSHLGSDPPGTFVIELTDLDTTAPIVGITETSNDTSFTFANTGFTANSTTFTASSTSFFSGSPSSSAVYRISVVPEPSSFLLLGLVACGGMASRWEKRRARFRWK